MLYQHGGGAASAGLNRVLIAAAAAGITGAVLAYVFAPKPAPAV